MALKRRIIDWLADMPGISGFSLYGVLHHPIKAFIIYPYLDVKWFIQRGRRGYSDCDSWNLGSYLSKWMPEAVRSLKDGHGVPAQLVDKDEPTDEDMARYRITWNDILEQIALGFEAQRILEDEMIMPTDPRYDELETQRKFGMHLFGKWQQSLWD